MVRNEKQKLDLEEEFFRSFEITRADIDVDKRTVELSFSSESPVERWYGTEILSHKANAVRLGRLNNRAPLLLEHDRTQQIGVVERAEVNKGKGRATVRFSKTKAADDIFNDVVDGIRSLVSVGYRIHKEETKNEDGGAQTITATDWEPTEISIVSVPADETVGVGRNHFTKEKPMKIEPLRRLLDPIVETQGGMTAEDVRKRETAASENATNAERKRVAEILALGEQFNCHKDAGAAISEKRSVEDFKDHVLKNVLKAREAEVQTDINVGLNEKEIREYSLMSWIRSRVPDLASSMDKEDRKRADLVADASRAMGAKIKRSSSKGVLLPGEILYKRRDSYNARAIGEYIGRALNTSAFGSGGAFVQTDILGGQLIELLRNQPLVQQMGATTLSGLQGDVAIPRQTGPATAYWLDETSTTTLTNQSVGQIGLTPRRLSAGTAYTLQLLAQSSIDVENFTREDIMMVLALAKDLAALFGTGDSQPLGIFNTPGVGTSTFGGSPTWAKVVNMETVVAQANALMGSLGYIASPGVKGAWKTTPKATNYPVFLWEGGDQVNGYKSGATNQIPVSGTFANRVAFGDWKSLVIGEWDGVECIVDPYTLAAAGQVRIIAHILTDIAIRHPQSFCISTDAGNQ